MEKGEKLILFEECQAEIDLLVKEKSELTKKLKFVRHIVVKLEDISWWKICKKVAYLKRIEDNLKDV